LFDTVAVYLAIDRDLVKMERHPVRITGDGFTRIVDGAKPVDCAVEWIDQEGFEDFLLERLIR
jgi:hypothetical protein